jgi:hypothetical protein
MMASFYTLFAYIAHALTMMTCNSNAPNKELVVLCTDIRKLKRDFYFSPCYIV